MMLKFDKIMYELKRRRIIRKGDSLYFDKGYFSKQNYEIAINIYKSSPLIFPRGKNVINKVIDYISYPLDCFDMKNNDKELYELLARKTMEKLKNWENYKGLRSKIEDFNKLLKVGLSLNKIHCYTKKSIHKTTYLNVLLGGLITFLGFRTKKPLQRLTEM
ncbi:MAG: Pseudogene of transposase [Methanobrevibacter sp. CfCl-M3]